MMYSNEVKYLEHLKEPSRTKITKAKFTDEEDKLLTTLVCEAKEKDWFAIAKNMNNRNARQCRERWNNYLDPNLVKDEWSELDDKLLMKKFIEIGSHWNSIARFFPGRSGNSIRNRYLMIQRHHKKKTKKNKKNLIFKKKELINEIIKEEKSVPIEKYTSQNLFDEIFSLQGLYDIFEHIE